MNEYTKQAGERVRIRRKQLKLSQEQLAEKIGYKGRGPVSKLESGDNAFKQPLVAKLAEALKTTPAYIMGWDEEPEEPRPIKNVLPIPAMRKVPIIGVIPCGVPITALEEWEGDAFLPESINADFALRAKGDSMTGSGKVPIIGVIPCGVPITALEEWEGDAFLPESINADFALRAKGDSMTGSGIKSGSIVFCKACETVENGKVAAVVIDDEATLKRFYNYGSLVVLRPSNPDFEDLEFKEDEINQIRIIGQAVSVLAPVK